MGAGQYFYPGQNQQQTHPSRHNQQRPGSPPNQRVGFLSAETPSPGRSTGTSSPAFGMFGQGHHQGGHSLLNGAQSHQRYQMQMHKHFSAGQSNQHQGSHHQNHGPDHNLQNGYAGHSHNISSGTLSSATPHFTPSHLQSNTPVGSHSGLGRPDTEHWNEQIRVAQASRELTQAHFFARMLSGGNKQGLPAALHAGLIKDDEADAKPTGNQLADQQPWKTLDFSGQGLKVIAQSLFRYPFLEKMYFNHNKLRWLTPQIGQLKFLTFLDLSQNQLTSLPPEVGMLVHLKALYLFDNQLETLPFEMGFLYQLKFLGIEGNPLNEELRDIMAGSGTRELITFMREHVTGK